MAKTNFQIFNEENSPDRTYNDSEYKEATQRLGGVMPGMALSRMHNKMYYQWSAMCKAIANLIVNRGRDCMDSDVEGITKSLEETITSAASGASLNLLQRSHTYQVGDIAYHKALPSWARLECVKAGTTGAELPDKIKQTLENGGVLITDGTVVWIIDDLRDGTPVGAVRGSLFLPVGYVKANGATVQRADYPRLVALADKHNLWTDDTTANAGLFGRGDGSMTMVLPNWMEVEGYANDNIGRYIFPGVPEITGGYSRSGDHLNYGAPYSPYGAISADSNHVDFKASRSSPIYGRSETVQPAAVKMLPIIRY